MIAIRRTAALAAVLLSVSLAVPTAQAGIWGDVLVGLDYTGFQVSGQPNPLSNGASVSFVRNFQNTPLDFGTQELTLNGPVVANVTTGNRFIRTLDFTVAFGTEANPLFYSYQSDVGSTATRIDGSAVFGMTGSVNEFGWYDLRLTGSNRQEVSSTGRFANTDGEIVEFDVGPIDISGNLFADLLATLTDPLFQNSGFENPFAAFSGRTVRENTLQSTVSRLQAKANAGQNLTAKEVSELVRLATEAEWHGDSVPDIDFIYNLEQFQPTVTSLSIEPSARQAIPEPASLSLLLVGAGAVVRRRR